MKIILTSVGTRGDMEPFIAIGEILKARGHQVICAFPEQFRELVTGAELEFASLGSKFIELLESPAGKDAMGGATGFKKIRGTIKLAMNQNEANRELVLNQRDVIEREQPDRVVYNGKAVFPVIWQLQRKGKTIFVSPLPYMHYVKGHTHIAFNSNYGDFFNKLTFSLAYFGLVVTTRMAMKWLGITEKFSRKKIRKVYQYNQSIYTISPSLFPRPDDWPKDLKVLGYHERKQATDWQPDQSLMDFLAKHDKIAFITFGSMINPAPEEKTRVILDILRRHKIPAIINTASGGLIQPANADSELFHFVSRIPYGWIFPKVYAVIHHGGSGTTHMGLRHGCATMIIPHIIDQFAWNQVVADLGVGPKGIKIGKITPRNLEPKILDLMGNPGYKKQAERIKDQMAQEDLEGELYEAVVG